MLCAGIVRSGPDNIPGNTCCYKARLLVGGEASRRPDSVNGPELAAINPDDGICLRGPSANNTHEPESVAMKDKEKLPSANIDDKNGPSGESDAQDKVAPETDERSPEEQKAEADLLKTSGGDPLTQER